MVTQSPRPSVPPPPAHRRRVRPLRREGEDSKERGGATRADDDRAILRSIRRGSDDWRFILRPFVSDLVFQSLVSRRRYKKSSSSFRSYQSLHAAVLFVDLSGYSALTAAVLQQGGAAHVLHNIVNQYLTVLLQIVQEYGGDVVKFAGDAVLIVFDGTTTASTTGSIRRPHDDSEDRRETFPTTTIAERNVLCATLCALDMQQKAGHYKIPLPSSISTDQSLFPTHFGIHCGISCGTLVSEVFQATTHQHMQPLYHSLSGQTMIDIGPLVDLAQTGEVCLSFAGCQYLQSVLAKFPESVFRTRNVDREDGSSNYSRAQIIERLHISDDSSLHDILQNHIEDSILERMEHREGHQLIEESFIHPKILQLLSHAGRSPTHIAQMRHLCVLFIGMTSRGRSTNWLMEIQGILDKKRCPIVQIIDDDKGVHVVAAINLYESIPEVSILGLEICLELRERQVGFALGMALGSTFCGVTGSSQIACRWDITGPTPVRAARLMQFALANEQDVVIDESLYRDQGASTRLALLDTIKVKGTPSPVRVYTLSDTTNHSALRILDTVFGSVHDDSVRRIQQCINDDRSRCAILVTGAPLAGKKIVCQRAAGFADMMPYMHVGEETAGVLQLGRTIATWLSYFCDDEVRKYAENSISELDMLRYNRSHDMFLDLIDLAVSKGCRACFIVDRVQFLDKFSLSLLSESLIHVSKRQNRRRPSNTPLQQTVHERGKIVFLCVHVSLYDFMSAKETVELLTEMDKSVDIPIITVGRASQHELEVMYSDMIDMPLDRKLLETLFEASGFLAGYFIERAAAIRRSLGVTYEKGTRPLAEVSKSLTFHVRGGCYQKIRDIDVMAVSSEVAMRYAQLFDELPPLYQTLIKCLALGSRKRFFAFSTKLLWEVLNDLIADGVEHDEVSAAIHELEQMFLVTENREDSSVSFTSPALGDIAFDVCTPSQIQRLSSTIVDRLQMCPIKSPNCILVMADLLEISGGEAADVVNLWRKSFEIFIRNRDQMDSIEGERWNEILEEEIIEHDYEVSSVLGKDYKPIIVEREDGTLDPRHGLLKIYASPVAFGPMGHTLNVITRNMFHHQRDFYMKQKSYSNRLRRATESALNRYVIELGIVEEFLKDLGDLGSSISLEEEVNLIQSLASAASSEAELHEKVVSMLDHYIPVFVENRRLRLVDAVNNLKGKGIPSVMEAAPDPLKKAYIVLQEKRNRNDVGQEALMILAASNWRPRLLPEQLPILYYQTVARVRNRVLRRADLTLFKHNQCIDDLEAFLLVTALLYQAQDNGICSYT